MLDPTLGDETTIGATDPDTGKFLHTVENTTCKWPPKTEGRKLRNYLDTEENQVAICTGYLTLPDMNLVHQDQAAVFSVGEVSKKLATDDAELNAKTGLYDPPGVALPLTGGQTAALFALLAGVAGGVSAWLFKRSRTRKGTHGA